jgi:hypothetical protein
MLSKHKVLSSKPGTTKKIGLLWRSQDKGEEEQGAPSEVIFLPDLALFLLLEDFII